MPDYSNLMAQVYSTFKPRRTTNTKLGNALTFMWTQHKKQNYFMQKKPQRDILKNNRCGK